MDDIVILPNDGQREALCELLHRAFVEVRALARAGKSKQVEDLADTFHTLPQEMFGRGKWDAGFLRQLLDEYQRKYPRETHGGYDFVGMLDRIFPPNPNPVPASSPCQAPPGYWG